MILIQIKNTDLWYERDEKAPEGGDVDTAPWNQCWSMVLNERAAVNKKIGKVDGIRIFGAGI